MGGAVHRRVDRLAQARDWLGRCQDRLVGRKLRPITSLDERAGETLAKWAMRNVLHARKRPVPSFGFALAPVLTHSVAARRQRRFRFLALASSWAWLGAGHAPGALAIAATVAAVQLVCGPRGRALARWGRQSVLSLLFTVAAAYGLWALTRPRATVLASTARSGAQLILELLSATTVVYLLDRLAAHAYWQSLRPGRKRIALRPRLAPRAAKRIAALSVSETWQTIAYSSVGRYDRFVGAGVDAWRSGATRIQLTPARTSADREEHRDDSDAYGSDGYRKFEADELLDRVRDELEDLRGVLVETHALPNCDVAEFLGVPQSDWKGLPRAAGRRSAAAWPEAEQMCTEARQPPTGHFARRYLAAQVVGWDGQLVVTLFAHAALEGKTLHFVTRPHILAPVSSQVGKKPPSGRALAIALLQAPLHACGDTVALIARMYVCLGRGLGLLSPGQLAAAVPAGKDDGLPVSLREHCGDVEPSDMHQREDVRRYVSILQARMFSTVTTFLADHGLATAELQRQIVQINQNIINGNNNQITTGDVNGNVVNQDSDPGPTDAPGEDG